MFQAVVAMSQNNVIGNENALLWHLPADLRRFRTLTTGHSIIMGRKTFESLPCILPNRHHIVLSREDFLVEDERVTVVHSIGDLLACVKPENKYFVIGGGEIYRLLLPLCDTVHMTIIHQNFEGDTTFPELNDREWVVAGVERGVIDSENVLSHRFLTMKRG